jgi:hypothetical protein
VGDSTQAEEMCRDERKMIYDRMRSRLTLRGFKQREGSQYDKYGTSAPAMRLGSVVMILILAVLFKLHVRMADQTWPLNPSLSHYDLKKTTQTNKKHVFFWPSSIFSCLGYMYRAGFGVWRFSSSCKAN